jgi:hypothetical protein
VSDQRGAPPGGTHPVRVTRTEAIAETRHRHRALPFTRASATTDCSVLRSPGAGVGVSQALDTRRSGTGPPWSYSLRVGVVPPHLEPSVNLLLRTFPTGVPEEEYLALLVALDEKYSEENLGIVVGEVTGFDPVVVVNDHAKAMSRQRPNPATVQEVATRLQRNGLDDLE